MAPGARQQPSLPQEPAAFTAPGAIKYMKTIHPQEQPVVEHYKLVGYTINCYDPSTDSLGPPTAIPPPPMMPTTQRRRQATRGVGFDPMTGRIVMREQPPYSPTHANSDEDVSKGRKSVREKETTRWSSVAAVRKPGGKARVTYVCSNCGEGLSQWWGVCRLCEATGALTKYYPGAAGADSPALEGAHHAYLSWIPQKSKPMVPQSLQEVTKGLASIVSGTIGAGESSAVVYVSGEEVNEQRGLNG
uniref:LapB rubredoxin metal binding domain-containing protein n=1 Tax=Leersia perrieri TaxID=77586 RepID=A0A0D9WLW8_9ORYZ